MKKSWLFLCGILLLAQANLQAQEVLLHLEKSGDALRLAYETIPGKLYEIQQSPNLSNWVPLGPAKTGDGQPASQEIVSSAEATRFFRLVITETPAGFAPTETEAASLFVGTTWEGYAFSSATRYCWRTDCGNWSYEKTGPDTALIVFTYDEDDNNPQVYREEAVLTFTSPTSGSYRYSEIWYGMEDPDSVSTAPFNL
jgi:hypothetical protein